MRAVALVAALGFAAVIARELWKRHLLAALEREATARAAAARDRARD